MKTDKVYQEKTARTIQQKLDGGGALQFIDNRAMNLPLQRISEEEDDTLQGKFDKAIFTNEVGHYHTAEIEQYRTAR